MKKLNLTALVLSVALFTGLGVTSVYAEGAKCGAGKCGDAKPAKTSAKCGAEKKGTVESTKCGAEKEAAAKSAKCGAGKCGDAKPVSKCGTKK
ncbi:MAG: hypothetical protein AUK54_07400 [Helicobacteraceae bacterium CG2_30_36_10]|nr:MAG: hypothetical protein AUK54_07400 [Helicobacteraceae bacterium CG2_30_36_10]